MVIMRFDTNHFGEMERLFEQTRRSMGAGRASAMGPYKGGQGVDVLSSNDVNLGMDERDDGYLVTADMPGFEKTDIDLRFQDSVLTIRADLEVTEETDRSWQRRSRHVHEQLVIPGDVLEADIDASYRNGVLEVHLPRTDDADPDANRIDID
jgi:HSP20 family protein